MKDKTEETRHLNLIKFIKSAFAAYSVFAAFLILAKLFIDKKINIYLVIIYVAMYCFSVLLFLLFVKFKIYLRLKNDKNFFIIPAVVGLILGQFYFYSLENARWVYITIIAVSYLGITYQSHRTVFILTLSSATANLILTSAIHIFHLQNTDLAADLAVVLSHFVLSFFTLPVTKFFNNISESYKDIVRMLRERNHIIEKDLQLAYTIQKSLLPSEYPKTKGFRFVSKYIPMDVIGGDFYDFIHINDHLTGILISDVSGHGVPAALITSMIKVATTSINKQKLTSPSKFLLDVNKMLLDKTATNFITAFYAILDTNEMTLKFSNAGHCPPLHYSEDDNKISKLETEGIVLGAFENISCQEKTIDLKAGDKIVLYTDGLTETANEKRELYGFNGLKSFTKANHSLPINAFIHCLFEDVKEWSNYKNFKDDIIIIGIDVL